MRKRIPLLLLAAILGILLSGCGARPDQANNASGSDTRPTQATESTTVLPAESSDSPSPSASPAKSDPIESLKRAARDAVDILRERDLNRLAKIVDPEKGLRFSPYAHIDEKTSLLFQADELPSFKDTKTYTWGVYDGSGEPIELSFRDYFEKFVYNQDFSSAPDVSINSLKGQGNVPFNGTELYPDASYVEYHFSGFDKKNEGMDWESLILVMRPVGQEWKLCAIVHAGWTI